MMIPAVVLVALLVTPALSLPLTTQEFITTSAQDPQSPFGNTGFDNPQTTTAEKSQIAGASQTATGTNEGSFAETSPIKTGAEAIPSAYNQNADQTGYQTYSAQGQTVDQVVTRKQPATPTQYSGSETTSQAEQAGVQDLSTSHSPAPKGENVPVNVGQQQPHQAHQPENSVLLPIQPLTVVPVNQAGQFLEPVVVPVETVTAGRVIIMAVKPSQQRNFQDVNATPEKQVLYQQTSQTVNGAEQVQTEVVGFGQPVEKKGIQTDQVQIVGQQQPQQVPFVREQVAHNSEVVQQTAEPVPNYVQLQAVEPSQQTYSVQPSQSVNEFVQKQASQQSTGYTSGQTQFVESTIPQQQQQQLYSVQQQTEKQGALPQTAHDEVPHQVQTFTQQQNYPAAVDSVQSQQPYQPDQFTEIRISDPSYQQQSVEGQTPYQQNTYVPTQNQPLVQQYSVQPESQHNYVPVDPQSVQQKISGGQTGSQESSIPLEQTQTAYQSGEKQLPYQLQNGQYDQVQPQGLFSQQQTSSVQPFAGAPAEAQVYVQQAQPDAIDYVPQQLHKTSEEQPYGVVVGAQPPQIVNYAEPVYNFGDKIPQQQTVHQSTPFTSCQQ